jgi:hypothetical protein
MGAAVADFRRGGITIAAARVARIAAHQIGDEDPWQPAALDHSPQQLSRTVAAEGYSGAVATKPSRRDADKSYIGGRAAVARDYARSATYQRLAPGAGLNRGS